MVTFFKNLRGKKIDAECDNSAPADRNLKPDSLLKNNPLLAGAQSPASSARPGDVTASPSHSNGTTDTVLSPQQQSATAAVPADIQSERKTAAKSASTYGDEKLVSTASLMHSKHRELLVQSSVVVVGSAVLDRLMLRLRHRATATSAM